MKDKKTRKQIFEQNWLRKFRESNKIKFISYDGNEMHIEHKEIGIIVYNVEMNYVYLKKISSTLANGLKWILKHVEL